eukprot:1312323-Rhodomonas_salina.1
MTGLAMPAAHEPPVSTCTPVFYVSCTPAHTCSLSAAHRHTRVPCQLHTDTHVFPVNTSVRCQYLQSCTPVSHVSARGKWAEEEGGSGKGKGKREGGRKKKARAR